LESLLLLNINPPTIHSSHYVGGGGGGGVLTVAAHLSSNLSLPMYIQYTKSELVVLTEAYARDW
jgi:hypothetical protein